MKGLHRHSDLGKLLGSFQESQSCFPLLWWWPKARDACAAIRKMRGTLGPRVRQNAHDHDRFCSCAREVYWPSIYAFLLMFQEVRPIRKTCNQLIPKSHVGLCSEG